MRHFSGEDYKAPIQLENRVLNSSLTFQNLSASFSHFNSKFNFPQFSPIFPFIFPVLYNLFSYHF